MRLGPYTALTIAAMLVVMPHRGEALESLSAPLADDGPFNQTMSATDTSLAGAPVAPAKPGGVDLPATSDAAPASDQVDTVPLSLQDMARSLPQEDAAAFEALPEPANPEARIAHWFSDNLANIIRWSVILPLAALVGAALRKKRGTLSF